MSSSAVRLIVLGPGERHILAVPNGLAGWQLPRVAVEWPTAMTATDVAAASRLVGAPLTPVRRVTRDVWEFEAHDRIPALGKEWVAMDQLLRLGPDKAAVDTWHDDPGTVGYLRPGGVARNVRWAAGHGFATEPTVVLRHWALGSVVRCGDVVVKEAHPSVTGEADALAALQGAHRAVPDLLASDGNRIAIAHNDGLPATVDDWPLVLRTLGEVQRASIGRVDALRPHSLDHTNPQIHAALDAVAALDLPRTVVHGDVHQGNVLLTDDGPRLIDWTDACAGSPLVSIRIAMEHLDSADAIRHWAAGFDIETSPVEEVAGAIRIIGSAAQEQSYRSLRAAVPADLFAEWDDWHRFWVDRLASDIAESET